MKRLLTLLLTAVIFVGALVLVAPKAMAASAVTVTDSAGVNMREGPGTSYNKVIAIPVNTQLTVQETKEADGYTWGKVTYDGNTGWIALEFTNYDPSAPSTPPASKVEWKKVDGKWYYYIDGVMQTGWQKYNGDWYYMDANGVMLTGWLEQNGAKYYLRESGAMVIGKILIDGKPNKFNQNGVWQGIAKYMTSDACLNILKSYEGFSAKPYWDYAQWTVGYGTECPKEKLEYYKQYGITEKEAEILLRDFIIRFEEDVEAFINQYGLELTPGQYDALVSFSYNCGSGWTTETGGTFHNAIKNGAKGSELLRAFGLWCSAGGEILPGLIERRKCEANMYLNGAYTTNNPTNYCHIYYDVNGGNKVNRVQVYDSNEPPAVAETPTHATLYFAGWYTAKEGGNKVTQLTQSLNGKTLYARWSATPVTQDPAPEPSVPNQANNVVTVDGDALNVRKGPGTNYDKVTQLVRGDQVAILEITNVGGYVWGRYTNGWIRLDFTDYHSDTFRLPEGWYTDAGKQYYFKNGKEVTGWQLLDGTWYYFNSQGVMKTGWLQEGKAWYYLQADGKMQKGWLQLGTAWYYMNSSGVMQTGWLKDGGKTYYLSDSGRMLTGLQTIAGKTYYFGAGGAMQTGLITVGDKKYFFDDQGIMHTGWKDLEGNRYYFDGNGTMVKGWLKLNGLWYYLNSSGVMQTGWLDLGPTRYYLGTDGVMATGTQTIDGETHRFNASGAWVGKAEAPQKNGWVQESGKWYYYQNGNMKTGWAYVGNYWYYMNSQGVMQTGWLKLGNTWYYLKSSGAMATGWLQLGSKWYYLKSSGEMVTGTYAVGPVTYKFDSNGAWIG